MDPAQQEAFDRSFSGLQAAWSVADKRPIYEWAAENLTLPGGYSPPGRFDVNYRRPLIAVFDAIQDPLVRRVRFRKPPRFGGSMVADIAIPWIICNDPGPIMWNWQKQDAARGHMKEKAWPLWWSSKLLRAMMPAGKYDRTATEIFFGDFFMVAQGASPNNLQGKGIRWQFNDEIWLPVWQDLYRQAVSRTRDFAETECEKVVDVSQAGDENDIEDANWREGNQAVWGYLAPNGQRYPLLMGGKREDGARWGLIWSDDAKRQDGTINRARAIETSRYVCQHTGHVWTDCRRARAEWNRDGDYIDMNPSAPRSIRSFSTNALLNNSFADLVARKIAALEMAGYGDMSALRDLKQQDECLPWKETVITISLTGTTSGYKYADHFDGQKWEGEVDRFMTIDRQQGMAGETPHWWVDARAWKINGDSRQLYFGKVETIENVREIQTRLEIADRKTFEDANFDPAAVFKDCARFDWIGICGDSPQTWVHISKKPGGIEQKNRLPYSPMQTTKSTDGRRVFFMRFDGDYMKDILANLVSGRGARWELPDDVSPEYLKHLQSEHKIEKRQGVFRWEKIHSTKPNHGWDTSAMQVVIALATRRLGLPRHQQQEPAASQPSTP